MKLQRHHICRHEAAHFILAWITGTKPKRIAIRKNSGAVFIPEPLSLETELAIYAAGPIIDFQIMEPNLNPEIFIPAYVALSNSRGKHDFCKMSAALKKYDIPAAQWWDTISKTVIQTAGILKDNEPYVQKIADFLNRHGSADPEITTALFQTLPKNRRSPITGKHPIWEASFFLEFMQQKNAIRKNRAGLFAETGLYCGRCEEQDAAAGRFQRATNPHGVK